MRLGEVEKTMLQVVAGPFAHIFVFWSSQNATLARSRKQWFNRLPALTRHFILTGLSKLRIGRGRKSNVASGRRGLRTYFLLLCISKYDFSEVEKTMIQGVAWHYLGILYILAYPNCDLGDVEKAMLQVVAGPFAHMFAFCLSQNTTLARSRKRWFNGLPGTN